VTASSTNHAIPIPSKRDDARRQQRSREVGLRYYQKRYPVQCSIVHRNSQRPQWLVEIIDELIDVFVAVREALTRQELANLTNSMQDGLRAVIAANGGQTNCQKLTFRHSDDRVVGLEETSHLYFYLINGFF
jgi:hypothetical protein